MRNTAETCDHRLLVYPPGNLKVCSKWGFPGAGVDMLHPANDRTSTTTTTSATSTTTTSATSDNFESNLNNKFTKFSFVEPSPTSFNAGTWFCNQKKLKRGESLCLCVLFAPCSCNFSWGQPVSSARAGGRFRPSPGRQWRPAVSMCLF